MPMLNPFEDDAWSQTSLTDLINRREYASRRVSELFGWNEQGVTSKMVAIDMTEQGLDIIDAAPYNGVPQQLTLKDGDPIPLFIPSHPAESVVRAEEVSARRVPGTENDTETVEMRRAQHADNHVESHTLSHEVDRIGALMGASLKRDGSVKTNLAQAFGKAPNLTDFDFDDVNADIVSFFLELKDYVEETAADLAIQEHRVLAPTALFRKAVKNKYLREVYKYYQQPHLLSDKRKGFEIVEGVWLEQYSPNFLIPRSGGRRAFPLDKMIMAPIAPGNYQTRFAPRQDLTYVNTVGLPMYMVPTISKRGESLELYSESNHVHYVRYPESVVLVGQTGEEAPGGEE